MELHQLRYFVAVVDEGTFTAAAVAVRISQSGVSTQLQKLERELGVALIDRSARRVALTPAGQRLLPYARAAIAAVEEVTGAANDIRGLVTGSLRVATVTGLIWPPLFDALGAVYGQHPGIDLRLHEGNSDQLIAKVRDGLADLAVAAWSGEPPEGVQTVILVDDPLVAVVADDHPWRARKSIRPHELARADLIALPPGTGARAALDSVLARADARRVEPRWEVSSPAYLQMLASRGIGIGVVSATTAEGWDAVTAIPISDDRARSQFGLVWQQRPSHAAQALLEHVLPRAGNARAETQNPVTSAH